MAKTATRTATTTKYFLNCKSVEELKKLYHDLARKFHPDIKGGCLETMKLINAEFDKVFEILKDIHAKKDGSTYEAKGDWKTTETGKVYRGIIEALLHLEGIVIEIVGSWVWVSGEKTKEYKDTLKELKFFFSAPKKAWYYNAMPQKGRHISHYKNLDEVKAHWHTVKVDGEAQKTIEA